MPDERFWSLIAVMDGRSDEEALGRLAAALRARPAKDSVAFQERLARVLFDLDREELAAQPVRFRGDPPDEDPIPLSDDSFLYLRAGIVIAGQQTCERVVREPSLLAHGEWDECEDLLYVAEEVRGDEIDTKVSYETGSNTKYWPPRPEPEREPWDQGLRPVVVDCRDLSDPIEGETYSADGRVSTTVDYMPPRYLGDGFTYDLSTACARIVATNGGLPSELAADLILVQIDFADSWRLSPTIEAPREGVFEEARELPVRVAVRSETVRGWTSSQRVAGLTAVAASCLLAVLPDTSGAIPELEQLRQAGADHLPR